MRYAVSKKTTLRCRPVISATLGGVSTGLVDCTSRLGSGEHGQKQVFVYMVGTIFAKEAIPGLSFFLEHYFQLTQYFKARG